MWSCKDNEIQKVWLCFVEELNKRAEEDAEGGGRRACKDYRYHLSRRSYKARKGVYGYKGDDLTKLAQLIINDPEKFRRINVLTFLRQSAKQIIKEMKNSWG